MSPRMLNMLLTAVFVLGTVQFSRAGIIISFDPAITEVTIPTVGSTSFTIAVQMRTDVGTAEVGGYDIPIDLSAPVGSGLPVGWSVTGFTKLADFGAGGFFPGPNPLSPGEGDFLVGDVNLFGTVSFNVDPVPLFSFTVDVSSAAQPGEFSARVVQGALLAVGGIARNDISVQNSALIRATAVPEPSSLIALTAASTLFLHRRRRNIDALPSSALD